MEKNLSRFLTQIFQYGAGLMSLEALNILSAFFGLGLLGFPIRVVQWTGNELKGNHYISSRKIFKKEAQNRRFLTKFKLYLWNPCSMFKVFDYCPSTFFIYPSLVKHYDLFGFFWVNREEWKELQTWVIIFNLIWVFYHIHQSESRWSVLRRGPE